MNKIEEIKQTFGISRSELKAKERFVCTQENIYKNCLNDFSAGFDAAIPLFKQITFQYIEWANHSELAQSLELNSDQLYDYFIENIFAPTNNKP